MAIVGVMSGTASVFMLIFFVELYRESRRIKLCKFIRPSDGEGSHIVNWAATIASTSRSGKPLTPSPRAEPPAKIVTLQRRGAKAAQGGISQTRRKIKDGHKVRRQMSADNGVIGGLQIV